MTRPERAAELVRRLPTLYPEARCDLVFGNALELLVATILSAQTTDKRVNLVTAGLFPRCRTATDYANIPPEELETLIRTANFFRGKARNIRAMAADLVAHHGGEVPRDMDALTALAGVGRKTANVVLGNAFGINFGVVVDTHVSRLSGRLKLTTHADPEKIEHDLKKIVPQDRWTIWSHWLIAHGRARCTAINPDCAACELRDLCPTAFRHGPAAKKKRSTGGGKEARMQDRHLP